MSILYFCSSCPVFIVISALALYPFMDSRLDSNFFTTFSWDCSPQAESVKIKPKIITTHIPNIFFMDISPLSHSNICGLLTDEGKAVVTVLSEMYDRHL